MQESQCVVFGPFRLDLRDERLWRGEAALPLHPKTFAVLRALVVQAGQLLTKDALFAAVWPDTAVSESVLTVAIRELRRVLGDQARRPQFIETVHGRGYRFIIPVTVAPPSSERPQTVETGRQFLPIALARPRLFVGREGELAQLHQWWAQAYQGRRQVGIIAGEPGMGKTALVDTFVGQVAAAEDCWVGHGRCVEAYGAGEPYLPVLEAVGRLCRGPEGPRLVAVLRQYAPSWLVQLPALLAPAEWEALQRTVGPTAPPRMLRELTDALDAFTVACPLVLVLEDLHWSDRATLAWLAYVARRPDPARLLLLGTYRPVEAIVHGHPLRTVLTELRQHNQCVELTLDYLSAAEVTAYLVQRFGDTRLAAALGGVLHQRTRGNPLFLTAVVDELVRQQVVTEEADGWAVRAGVDTISAIVPGHLRELIELQLAHCSPEDQTLLAAASVAGVEFATAAVAASLERADEEIEARCAALAHQGRFLQAHGQAAWPDGTVTGCYGFRHALYQEVVYQQVPASRQLRWHARIGTRLAQGFGEQARDMAAALALHCVRGRLWPQAVQYIRQAGQQAARRGVYQEAVAFYEQALHALQQLPEHRAVHEQAIDLRFDLRHALLPLDEPRRILDHLRQAEVLAEALGDQRRLGQIAGCMAFCLRELGDPDGSLASAQRALTIATALGDDSRQVAANISLGEVYLSALSDYRRAAEVFRRNVEMLHGALLERFGTAFIPSVTSRASLAMCLAELGAFAEGQAHGEKALRLAEAAEHPYSLAQTCAAVGYLYLRQGALPQAIRMLERGRALSEAVHLPLITRMCTARLGAAYALCGRVHEALPLLERALEQAMAVRRTLLYPLLAVRLGEGYILAGRVAEAMPLGQQALAAAQGQDQQGYQAYALRLLGECAAHGDPPQIEQATAHYQHALALADELGMRPLQAHCHHSLGMLYRKMGRQDQARAELSTAIALYRAMEITFWLPRAEAALAEVNGTGSPPRPPA
jgi:DNA-binding winged helix-turn-helix (wHTH) protein/tetratricopeptide (TPR) repeat protein